MAQAFIILAGLLGAAAVGLGAFGAHGLKSRLSPDRLQTFETGARYQVYHALALLGTALLVFRSPGTLLSIAGWLFVAGILLFSGSLYLLVFSGKRFWGAITPLGGLCFIAGWLCLALSAIF